MHIKPAGIAELETIVHGLNAAMEHVPPATRAILEQMIAPQVKALEAVLNPPEDKNMEHG